MKLEKKTIKDTGRIVTGKTPLTSNRDYFGGEYLFVTPTDLDFNNYYIYNTNTKISELGKSKHTNQFLPPNSVLFTCIGNTIGKIALNKSECLTNQQINSIIPNDENDFKFLYYHLISITPYIRNLGGGVATPIVNKTNFEGIEINIPPLPTQRKIASILSAYDDLIENNLKRIKLLEEKAFLSYKLIVRSEKLEEKSILDICYITDGTHDSPKQTVDGFYLVTGKHLIGGFIDFSSAYFISEADHDKIQKRSKVENGNLVLSNIGTIGNVAIIDSPFEFSVKNVIIFKPSDSVYTSFLYCYLNSNEMQTRFQQESSGTSQRFISLAYTRALKMKLPSANILKEFHQEVSSLLKLKSILNQQNSKHREARDILLPKLMNGQIEV